MNELTPEHILALAAAVVAAPSADNRHVVRMEATAGTLRLLATPDLLNAPSSRRMLGLLSVGAVTENLILRARRLGLQLEPRWHALGVDGPVLADFTCHRVPAVENPLEAAMELRHTNRRLRFGGPKLPPMAQAQLSAECADLPGTHLCFLDEPELRRGALRLVRWAETERFRNQELHREMFDSIRFDVGWHRTAIEGLSPGSLEVPLLERPAFSLLRHWKVQRALNVVGAHHFIGFRAADLPCRLSPHLCAISAEGDLEAAAVSAGRLLQRVWLRTTLMDLSFQVFAASAIYALDGATAISTGLRQRLASGWNDIGIPGKPFIVFRLGRAKAVSLRAGRPLAQSLLIAPFKSADIEQRSLDGAVPA